MSRRYRAPVKRRKTKKKTTVADLLADPSEPEALAQPAPLPTPAAPAPASKLRVATPTTPAKPVHHIDRDYSYVLRDLLRILAVLGLILISLIIAALFIR